MNKIIPMRSLLGYSLVLALCSFFIAANINIVLAEKGMEGVDFSHMIPNQKIWEMGDFDLFKRLTSNLLKTAIILTIVFLYTTTSYLIENQSDNLAKLALLGATRKQIIIVFFNALWRTFFLSILIGSIVGMCLSRFLARLYFFGFQIQSRNFTPHMHVLCVLYTVSILVIAMILTMLLSLRKLLFINPLGLASGRFSDLSRISYFRVICGIIMVLITLWYMLTVKIKTDDDVDNQLPILMGLVVASFFLLIPIILKLIMPVILDVSSKIFPITGLIAKRYFSARLRRYVSIAAPIVLCLMFSAGFFQSITETAQLNRKLYLNDDIPTSAVVMNVNPSDSSQLLRYQNIGFLGKDAAASPIREDIRWIDTAHLHGIPTIEEVNPHSFLRVFNAQVTAGDINKVHGMNFASSRTGDKVGELIHMLDPFGKKIDAHIVATIATQNNQIAESLIADYATIPYGSTSRSDPGHRNLLNFKHYDILYSGVSAKQLQKIGFPAISYSTWISQRIKAMWEKTTPEFYISFAPILGLCFALALVNSLSFSRNSQLIRRILKILGGSFWQDFRIMLLEFSAVFVLAIIMTPLPPLLNIAVFDNFYYKKYGVLLTPAFPYQQVTPILLGLIVSALVLPIIRILLTYRRRN